MLVCIAFLVFSKDVRLGEALPFLMGGLLGLAGFKNYKFEFMKGKIVNRSICNRDLLNEIKQKIS
ncbi:hypothetical protein [Brachyspira hyodysenteriae]|uniref:hypothetical protein n=1 Tax=Brachyspira hyodysenteriae TaxID=159 RepID=UPI0022CE156B|nr:hypothetical protein [Brachyspira hyodysenteriae]MDA0087631.1 hypothetical protein [Brachyspira hyodysenteriae]